MKVKGKQVGRKGDREKKRKVREEGEEIRCSRELEKGRSLVEGDTVQRRRRRRRETENG